MREKDEFTHDEFDVVECHLYVEEYNLVNIEERRTFESWLREMLSREVRTMIALYTTG